MGRDQIAFLWPCSGVKHPSLGGAGGDIAVERRLGFRIDHRPDMGGDIARIAHAQFGRRADQHVERGRENVLLQTEKTQGRTALAGGPEGRGENVVGRLFEKRGRIDDHRIDAAGFGDQRDDRAAPRAQSALDFLRRLDRTGEGHARHARIGDQLGAERAIAGRADQSAVRQSRRRENFRRRKGDARGLFRGFRHYAISRRERRRDLAGKNGEGKIPRRNADENAAPVA